MRIRVWLTSRLGAAWTGERRAEPVTFGVPLPVGQVKEGQNWRLSPSAGAATAVQVRVMDRWADGSVRWLLVDGRVDVTAAGPAECFLEPVVASTATPIGVSGAQGEVRVDTGATQFTLRAGGAFPFEAVQHNGAASLDVQSSGLRIFDRSGTSRPVSISSVEVEEQAPLRTVVLIRGIASAGGRSEALDLTARLHFFAGLSTVRLLVILTNPNRALHKGGFWDLGDPGSILIKGAVLTVAAPGPAAAVRVSPEIGVAWTDCAVPFELYQDSSGGLNWQSSNHLNRERRVPTTFRGYRLRAGGDERSGLRATPAVCLGSLSAAVPDFWQNFPRSIEASESALTLGLFPAQFGDLHEIQGGEQKTYECFLSFGGDEVSSGPLDWCRSRTIACVDPEWTLSSGAVPFLASLSPEHAALVDPAIDGTDTFERKREVIDEYGWRNFGEIYGDHESVRQQAPPIVSHYNNQYDPVAGFICQFMRTGDTRWWTMATELAAHVVDIDVYHTTRDKAAYNHGLFWHTYHYGDADTATHRTYPKSAQGRTHGGGPSADHNYTTGLMLHHFMTGDEASRRTVIDLGQFVIDLDNGNKTPFRWLDRGDTGRAILSATAYHGPGRGPANSLNALIDAHRLSGERRFLVKAEQLVKRVVHPREDIAKLRLDVPELRWFYTMFLQSLGKYLHYRVELERLDDHYAYARECLLHFGRWMLEHEHPYLEKPDKLEFPTETWPAQDIRKSDVLHFAAMHADPKERPAFANKARFFHGYAIEQLRRMPTRTLARPVVVLLTSGFLDGWRARHSAAAEPGGGVVRAADRTPFVPQRVRAERRAKQIAIGAATVGALAALLMLL